MPAFSLMLPSWSRTACLPSLTFSFTVSAAWFNRPSLEEVSPISPTVPAPAALPRPIPVVPDSFTGRS